VRTYEVFLKKDGKDEFRHAGAIDAPNDDLALIMARECYARRAEGDHLWVVDRSNIAVAEADFVAPNADKPHRHNDGGRVAARRKAQREEKASV
jgi:ring-1,2-phenylacetyl-CoA epoxidase subunit PaaB